jgi:hypothetical protein
LFSRHFRIGHRMDICNYPPIATLLQMISFCLS